jgi:hypothetical protein
MERVLVVLCPGLLEEQEKGREGRAFDRVGEAVGTFSPGVKAIRPGICAVGTRGPSRYFGGDERLARLVAEAVGEVEGVTPGTKVSAGVGMADGVFAALLAAGCPGTDPMVVAPGGTPGFLASWPVSTLGRPELADLLERLGIRSLGAFAALPQRDVLARFGVDGVACHRVARGLEGALPGLCLPAGRQWPRERERIGPLRQPEFWGGEAAAAARAAGALSQVQRLLGPEAVVTGRLQGGRGPGERARIVPWSGEESGERRPGERRPGERGEDGPWPGRVPPPAPVIVFDPPLAAALTDGRGRVVGVNGGGLVSAAPKQLSVGGGPWTELAGWAGPWPAEERWWSVPRRRARIQVVTETGTAHLLTRERGSWWVEGTYD